MTFTSFLRALFELGFDRLMVILCRAQSIRDVIALTQRLARGQIFCSKSSHYQ